MNGESNGKMPELYATENIPFEKKIIYRRYQIKELGFYWLIAELDKRKNIAFGYANLNDDELAEWEYIHIDELMENGAVLDEEWKPCTYKEAIEKISREREEAIEIKEIYPNNGRQRKFPEITRKKPR